jgi:hypothetical protein
VGCLGDFGFEFMAGFFSAKDGLELSLDDLEGFGDGWDCSGYGLGNGGGGGWPRWGRGRVKGRRFQ